MLRRTDPMVFQSMLYNLSNVEEMLGFPFHFFFPFLTIQKAFDFERMKKQPCFPFNPVATEESLDALKNDGYETERIEEYLKWYNVVNVV